MKSLNMIKNHFNIPQLPIKMKTYSWIHVPPFSKVTHWVYLLRKFPYKFADSFIVYAGLNDSDSRASFSNGLKVVLGKQSFDNRHGDVRKKYAINHLGPVGFMAFSS